jgi:cyclopropane fatty-acyl-phospholipid synthase-like methyltransferase
MVRFLLRRTASGVLVEAGCGTGEVSLEVARRRGDRVVLVDMSEEALQQAQAVFAAANIPVQALQCDVAELGDHLSRVGDATVFNIGVIEHAGDCTKMLQQMAALAGRKALVIVPERSAFWMGFVEASRRLRLVPEDFFILLYDVDTLKSAVRGAGLHVVGVERIRAAGLIPYLAVEFGR